MYVGREICANIFRFRSQFNGHSQMSWITCNVIALHVMIVFPRYQLNFSLSNYFLNSSKSNERVFVYLAIVNDINYEYNDVGYLESSNIS